MGGGLTPCDCRAWRCGAGVTSLDDAHAQHRRRGIPTHLGVPPRSSRPRRCVLGRCMVCMRGLDIQLACFPLAGTAPHGVHASAAQCTMCSWGAPRLAATAG
jgi:hypothetical protein